MHRLHLPKPSCAPHSTSATDEAVRAGRVEAGSEIVLYHDHAGGRAGAVRTQHRYARIPPRRSQTGTPSSSATAMSSGTPAPTGTGTTEPTLSATQTASKTREALPLATASHTRNTRTRTCTAAPRCVCALDWPPWLLCAAPGGLGWYSIAGPPGHVACSHHSTHAANLPPPPPPPLDADRDPLEAQEADSVGKRSVKNVVCDRSLVEVVVDHDFSLSTKLKHTCLQFYQAKTTRKTHI